MIKIIAIVFIVYFAAFPPNLLSHRGQICTNDKFLLYTQNINSFLKVNKGLRNFLQIFFFTFLDIFMLVVSHIWILYGKNWRAPMTIAIFFLLRETFNYSYHIKPDEDMLWVYPGFPSFTISYLGHEDFFFSGSCGLYIIGIMELKSNKFYKFSLICTFMMIGHVILLLSLRAQYFICILIGFFAGHYSFFFADSYSYLIDDLYDFNPELTQKKNEEKIKNMIELSIQKLRKLEVDKYKKLDNYVNTEVVIEFDNVAVKTDE
jgi:hypothetical protein